ncbi:MAG: hypothetical protein O3C57_06800, partial [Verrucomicrobia bacterium]|nr:hypothetical protein [Verrucomicrobiota bacterium]
MRQALEVINLTTNDLGFKKDFGKPRIALSRVRGLLQEPLGAPVLADELIAAYEQYDRTTIWYALPAMLLELATVGSLADIPAVDMGQDV